MRNAISKLRSNHGSSMIIALVFMLICVFVGGAVLTSATVNGGRIAGKYEQQQAILNQRSIISVFAASLANIEGKINLSVHCASDADGKMRVPYDSETGIKRAIFKAADEARNETATVDFTVTTPDGIETECYVTCISNTYKVTVGFKENPQLVLEMYAVLGQTDIHWSGGKIVKAGATK